MAMLKSWWSNVFQQKHVFFTISTSRIQSVTIFWGVLQPPPSPKSPPPSPTPVSSPPITILMSPPIAPTTPPLLMVISQNFITLLDQLDQAYILRYGLCEDSKPRNGFPNKITLERFHKIFHRGPSHPHHRIHSRQTDIDVNSVDTNDPWMEDQPMASLTNNLGKFPQTFI